MQLVSITLQNIRSYTQTKVDFPLGIVLLSGDIGSGKSTILLAIEFALFGLSRGELSGGALLRNGSNEGSVELTFKIKENTHTIRRTLKRNKTSVEQDSGHLITNGMKTIGTATELKARVLELLGYPSEMLTKKNIIYRYTVYTPQEEMKQIILESPEERLATLRKIFDIDKYERIKKNTTTFVKTLRERERALSVVTTDLEEKKKQAKQNENDKKQVKEQASKIAPLLEQSKKQINSLKTQIAELEQKKTIHDKLNSELNANKTILKSKEQQHANLQTDMDKLMKEIAQEPPAPADKTFILTEKNTVKTQITTIEKEMRDILTRQAELNAMKGNSEKITQQVTTLDNCPMCKQSVTHEHKNKITAEEKNKIDAIGKSLLHHDATRKEKDGELANLKIRLDNLLAQEKEVELAALRKTHYDKLQERHKQVVGQAAAAKNEIEQFKQKIMTLEEQTKPLAQNDTLYKTLRQEYDNTLIEERKIAIEHSTLIQKEQHIDATLAILQKDITHKETIKKQLENISETTHFLTDYFSPLMDVMERHTLSTIHHEFSTIFQHWFSVLIEETLTARLDEQFTPLVTQNGYDTDIAHLSGGERTACALAFRLALCKTVNSLIRTITTKDLLILDEPTDGFSSEQLDKMRDVLLGLGLSQIILVSHEQKIEGMADKIIRVRKENGSSIVVI